MQIVLFDPSIGPYQVLPLWARVDQRIKQGLRVPQSSSITEASPSDYIVSYPGHLLEESYPFAEMHLVYSAAPTNWARRIGVKKLVYDDYNHHLSNL